MLDLETPTMTFRGTMDEVLSHRSEIPADATVVLNVFTLPAVGEDDPTIALLQSWIADAPTNLEAIREAEEDLAEFKRNMNLARQEVDARLPYPDFE